MSFVPMRRGRNNSVLGERSLRARIATSKADKPLITGAGSGSCTIVLLVPISILCLVALAILLRLWWVARMGEYHEKYMDEWIARVDREQAQEREEQQRMLDEINREIELRFGDAEDADAAFARLVEVDYKIVTSRWLLDDEVMEHIRSKLAELDDAQDEES